MDQLRLGKLSAVDLQIKKKKLVFIILAKEKWVQMEGCEGETAMNWAPLQMEESLELKEAVHQTQKTCHLTVLMLKMWPGGFQDSLGVKTVIHNNSKMSFVFFIRILSQVYGGALQRLNDLCCRNRMRTQLSAIKAGIERSAETQTCHSSRTQKLRGKYSDFS